MFSFDKEKKNLQFISRVLELCRKHYGCIGSLNERIVCKYTEVVWTVFEEKRGKFIASNAQRMKLPESIQPSDIKNTLFVF